MTAAAPPGDAEIVWTDEARERLAKAPPFVRPGIEKLMARRARERGRAIVDSEFLTEIRNESMLLVARCLRRFGFEGLSREAFDVARARMRRLPEKLRVLDEIEGFLARRSERNTMVLAKFQRYLEMVPDRGLPWTEEALARIQRAPDGVRPLVRQAIEAAAREARERLVSGAVVDRCIGGLGRADPSSLEGRRADGAIASVTMLWTAEAEERLRRIPLAAIRAMVVRQAEARARSQGLFVVDAAALGNALARGEA
jgi:hypothetical protein